MYEALGHEAPVPRQGFRLFWRSTGLVTAAAASEHDKWGIKMINPVPARFSDAMFFAVPATQSRFQLRDTQYMYRYRHRVPVMAAQQQREAQ